VSTYPQPPQGPGYPFSTTTLARLSLRRCRVGEARLCAVTHCTRARASSGADLMPGLPKGALRGIAANRPYALAPISFREKGGARTAGVFRPPPDREAPTPLPTGSGLPIRPAGGEVCHCTRRDHRGRAGRLAASLQRFTGNPSPLVSRAPWWDTSGALAQPAAAADAVGRPRFSKPSWPARLILFRWATHMDR
jgi:hypothetical protein